MSTTHDEMVPGHAAGPQACGGTGHEGGGPDRAARAVRSWPLLVLALPASVAVWSGWVGIGQMTGFGIVRPLPGIWDSLRIDSAVTLPVGVEAYAAMALHAWLTSSHTISARTRVFARWSAIGALMLGMAGQVAYHLMAEAHMTRAPWEVTTLIASLPVLVLGLGTALAHMLHADAAADRENASGNTAGPAQDRVDRSQRNRASVTDQAQDQNSLGSAELRRLGEIRSVAENLTATGQKVSRRSLRAAGVHGSNAELSELARLARTRGTVAGADAGT